MYREEAGRVVLVVVFWHMVLLLLLNIELLILLWVLVLMLMLILVPWPRFGPDGHEARSTSSVYMLSSLQRGFFQRRDRKRGLCRSTKHYHDFPSVSRYFLSFSFNPISVFTSRVSPLHTSQASLRLSPFPLPRLPRCHLKTSTPPSSQTPQNGLSPPRRRTDRFDPAPSPLPCRNTRNPE